MPNPYHFRANIDRLWRRVNSSLPGYVRLKALNAVAREIYPANDRTEANYRMYLATDPYDVARHKLRDLYDSASRSPLPPPDGGGRCLVEACPALDAGTEGGLPGEEQPANEDDDPL